MARDPPLNLLLGMQGNFLWRLLNAWLARTNLVMDSRSFIASVLPHNSQTLKISGMSLLWHLWISRVLPPVFNVSWSWSHEWAREGSPQSPKETGSCLSMGTETAETAETADAIQTE